jgi:hypothetical protein
MAHKLWIKSISSWIETDYGIVWLPDVQLNLPNLRQVQTAPESRNGCYPGEEIFDLETDVLLSFLDYVAPRKLATSARTRSRNPPVISEACSPLLCAPPSPQVFILRLPRWSPKRSLQFRPAMYPLHRTPSRRLRRYSQYAVL